MIEIKNHWIRLIHYLRNKRHVPQASVSTASSSSILSLAIGSISFPVSSHHKIVSDANLSKMFNTETFHTVQSNSQINDTKLPWLIILILKFEEEIC